MRMFARMDDRHAERDLARIKWIGVLLPVTFVWAFELLRFAVLDPAYPRDTAHVVSGLLMAAAVVAFAAGMARFFDRAQRQIVAQNRHLTLTHGVSAAARDRLELPEMLSETLAQMVDRTGALAGVARVDAPDDGPLVLRRPPTLPPGLSWVGALLDTPVDPPPLEPTWSEDRAVDSGILDVPLMRGRERLGRIRLVFHPAVRPEVSAAALADIAGEIATAVQLGRLVEDLRRREHERAALYEVALQLTGRADLRETLDTITRYARELLSSDRAIVCVADSAAAGSGRRATDVTDRIALADNGTTCTLAHTGGPGAHPHNPHCPLVRDVPPRAFASRPLRSPDGNLGELCVVREAGSPYVAAEMTLLGALADMAAIAVRTARLREAEEQWTILSERDRIARELHDSLAQVLGVIHLRLRALESTATTGAPDGIATDLADLADVADEAYRDVREAILGLRETISAEIGLEGALRDYLRKYSRQTGIRTSFVCDGDVRRALPPRSEVQLLRVVQEALTNVRKHAGASQVTVRLDCRTADPVVSVEDDGVGFDPARAAQSLDGGFGLTSMRERVDQIGGTLDVHTAPGEGTRIVVHLGAEEARVAPTTPPAGAARR
jgi:two-component system nitrate/nitrite sensor histidine kinase NarX